jgi:arginyl-tRNA synthetase
MRVYDILGIGFDSFAGESFYRDKTANVIQKIKDCGLLKESDGAMIVSLDDYDMPPCLIAKKDGSSIYATRDLAAILYRKETYNFDRCLYVTGQEQKLHFAQVFKVIELMGNDYANHLIHIPYGLVSLKDGKISSRKGNVIFAEDILRESINKTTSIIEEKNPDIPNKEEVAKQIGIGAIIFNDLYNQRIKDVIFDWDKLLNFDGETGPYVQYTYARASSVLRKTGDLPDTIDYSLLTDDASMGLLKEIERYPEVIKDAAERYEPFVVARYSIDLAHAFNKFYHECQINVDDFNLKCTRTNIVKIARFIIKDSLSLLGIQCPEQM